MANPVGKALVSAPLAQKEPHILDTYISLASGVPSLSTNLAGYPIIFGTATNTAPLTQAAIDSFLGVSGDITAATSFGSTAMGTDSIGFVINMQGQAQSALWEEAVLYDSTRIFVMAAGAGTTTTALTDALSSAFAVTPAGNLYGRLVVTGLDSSSNLLRVKLAYYLKNAV
jgi:hypothetical protein